MTRSALQFEFSPLTSEMAGFLDSEKFKNLINTNNWADRAIDYLYDHYHDSLVHIAERKTRDRKTAEDIVQEAFIEVWQKSEWLLTQKDLLIEPYLIGIVKNKAVTFYNQRSRLDERKAPYSLDDLLGTLVSKESEMIQSDKHKTLRDIVATLPARERECTEMRFFQEMSIEAIAIRLGITVKGVEKNITSGLKRLRRSKSSLY